MSISKMNICAYHAIDEPLCDMTGGECYNGYDYMCSMYWPSANLIEDLQSEVEWEKDFHDADDAV